MKAPRNGSVRLFVPVGMDVWDPKPWHPRRGTRVRVVQPRGCPRNGTMGHVYVADADSGKFLGLVLVNSLQREDGV